MKPGRYEVDQNTGELIYINPNPDINDVLTEEVNTLGAKNLLPYVAGYQLYTEPSQTRNGITYTVNDDGTIDVDGTTPNDNHSFLVLSSYSGKNNWKNYLEDGEKYIISGCPAGGSINSFILQFAKGDGTEAIIDTGEGAEITCDTSINKMLFIYIAPDTTVNHLLFKPMIRPASIKDDTWVPYSMTNRQITEQILNRVDLTSNQSISGTKTFTKAVMIDESDTTQTLDTAYNVLSFKYKNPDSQVKQVNVIRTYGDSETGSANNGIAILGSSSGATIISSGESAPAVIADRSLSNNEIIAMIADTAITFYTHANTPANVVYCGGFEASGKLQIQEGIVFNTASRLETAKNLTNESVTNPTYFVGLTNSWGNFGHVTVANARKVLRTDYQVGDVYQVSSGVCSFPGVLTGSSKDIIFTVALPKPLSSDITTITINTLSGSYRGTNGYAGGAQNVDILNIAGTTTSVQGMDRNAGTVTIKTHYDTALTTPTNNSPIIFTGSIKLTFS